MCSALKFYLFWCFLLVVVLLAAKQPVGTAFFRSILIGVLILIAFAVFSIKQIYSIEQKAFAELDAIESVLYEDVAVTKHPNPELVNEMLVRISEFEKHQKIVWWEFRIWSLYQYKWFYRTFIKRTAT